MTKKDVEDFIYKSYLAAAPYQDKSALDSTKRHPELTRDLIKGLKTAPCVCVTGSRGKGSVSLMLSSLLSTTMRVGLMTSPHVFDFCERFRINEKPISDDDLIFYARQIQPAIDELSQSLPQNICISPIGIQAILAMHYFNARGTGFNIFEGGKGAQYDDVNNIPHEYAIINTIFDEHTRELGGSVEAIAADKSHIITGGQKCIYVGSQSPAVKKIILDRAAKFNVPVKCYGDDFIADNIRFGEAGMSFDVIVSDTTYKNITIPLLGVHQARNCALAFATAHDILSGVPAKLNLSMSRDNLSKISWPGRMEVLCQNPFILFDACINKTSCREVVTVINELNLNINTVIICIQEDKDYIGVATEISKLCANIILTKSQSPHYSFSRVQCDVLHDNGIESTWADDIGSALSMCQSPVIILGSISLIDEIKAHLKEKYL